MLAMTSDFHGTSRQSGDVKGALARIAAAGFSHVHWCHEWTGSYLYSVPEMLQIRAWCDELGLGVKGVHASAGERGSDLKDYISANDYNRLSGAELVRNRIDLAYILGTDAIVLHLGLPWDEVLEGEDRFNAVMRPVFRTFDELEPYCSIRRMTVCIENGGGPVEANVRVFDALFKRYSCLGLCFDTGHGYLHCKGNCLEYARRYTDRMHLIHIHDNHGEKDEHILPFKGGFDWEGFAPLLARSPYRFPVLMEPQTSVEGDDSAWLKEALEAGNKFAAMVEKYR